MSSEAALPRRIVKETQRLLSEPAPGISATPCRDNLRYFNIIIAGPTGSPYESGIFKLELFLPEQYPMESPKVRFLTKIYHPNIDKLGRICLDILKDKWSPALQIHRAAQHPGLAQRTQVRRRHADAAAARRAAPRRRAAAPARRPPSPALTAARPRPRAAPTTRSRTTSPRCGRRTKIKR